jgi:hypothetical protein
MTSPDPDAAVGQRLLRIAALVAEQQAEPTEEWLRRVVDDARAVGRR